MYSKQQHNLFHHFLRTNLYISLSFSYTAWTTEMCTSDIFYLTSTTIEKEINSYSQTLCSVEENCFERGNRVGSVASGFCSDGLSIIISFILIKYTLESFLITV